MIALKEVDGIVEESAYIRDNVLPSMSELRIACDEAETLTAKSYWPYPSYGDILFSVH
jgi:glutamine synthetase